MAKVDILVLFLIERKSFTIECDVSPGLVVSLFSFVFVYCLYHVEEISFQKLDF